MTGLLCVACVTKEAMYIYMGKSLCAEHFDEWSDYARKATKPEKEDEDTISRH